MYKLPHLPLILIQQNVDPILPSYLVRNPPPPVQSCGYPVGGQAKSPQHYHEPYQAYLHLFPLKLSQGMGGGRGTKV